MMSAENDALREAAAIGWDAAVAAMKYEDGTPVEVVSMVNPYRPMTCGDPKPHEAHRKVGDGRPCDGVVPPAVAGCCDSCGGKGGTMSGPCWDCRGTGCAHRDPCVIPPADGGPDA